MIYPAGTAPGLVVPPARRAAGGGGAAGAAARAARDVAAGGGDASFRAAVAGGPSYEQAMLRLFGIPESEIAETLRVAEERGRGLRRSSRSPPACAAARSRSWCGASPTRRRPGMSLRDADRRTPRATRSSPPTGPRWTSRSPSCCRAAGSAVAESCTGGLMAARLTERPGSSDYVAGGVVAYSNEAKAELLGVDPALIERHGAVSPRGGRGDGRGRARRASRPTPPSPSRAWPVPGGGTEEKPVGYVCWSVKGAEADTRPRRAPARRPQRGPRPLDHGRRCTSCAGPPWGESALLARRRARLFVALDLPEPARASLAAWRDDAGRPAGATCVRSPPRRCT